MGNKITNFSNSTSNGDSAFVVRSIRDEKPIDYTLKIQFFSWLRKAVCKQKTQLNRYESQIFNASGYKWKLALYPNGDEKRNGHGNISLYLVTAEDDILSSTSEIHVMFTFLVYDGIRDKYLTVQDGKIRRFHAMKTEWGFEKLVSLSTFNDASNGLLINDCCAFGVDIVVMKPKEGKGELVSLIKQSKNHKYTWKCTDFSHLDIKYHESHPFKVESYNWKILLHPRRNSQGTDFLSLYLQLNNLKDLPQGFQVYVEYEIAVLNQLGLGTKKSATVDCWFGVEVPVMGYGNFMSLRELEEPKNGYLYNNTIIVEIKINAISTVKNCF